MSLAQEIANKKEKVQAAITAENRLEGQIENQMNMLKTQYMCKSIKAATIMSSRLEKRARQKEKELEKGLEKLEEDYPFE